MSLETALDLAKQGFHVFPIIAGTKKPAIKSFPTKATRDEETIKGWWTCRVTQRELAYNIGISTTRFGDNQALVVVDLDVKENKNGFQTALALEFEGKDLTPTRVHTTPREGEHRIYAVDQAISQGNDKLGPGIDIRSAGGYIVAPGSTFEEKEYAVKRDVPVTVCPQWIVDTCGREMVRAQINKAIKVNIDLASERAIYYLEHNAPVSIQGDAGDQTAYKVAAKLKDMGLDQVLALELMQDHWNDRCQPPWSPEELEIKVNNAYSYGKKQQGIDSAEADFKKEVTNETAPKSYLEEINESYALVFLDGGHKILHETKTDEGLDCYKLYPEASFRRKLSHKKISVDGKSNTTVANEWLDWQGRRAYEGIGFYPETPTPHGFYNIWKGFTVTPTPYDEASTDAKAGFDSFIDHAKENVCGGDEELFTWLMGYFAHMIQRPYERPLTTVVFQGSKGVGKNTLVERIGFLLGDPHFAVVDDGKFLTGRFNGHMEGKLAMVFDEAFWSGDKSAEGKLKGLTTASKIYVEGKGLEVKMIKNLMRIFIIGNEDWLVPASVDERRYAVFSVGEGRKKDNKYFEDMRINLDQKGGAEVLLHYLKNFNLKDVDVNTAPNTVALSEQKIASMDLIQEFWLKCLSEGRISGMDFSESWPEKLVKIQLWQAFESYCKHKRVKARGITNVGFGKKIHRMCPSFGVDTRVNESGKRSSAYAMPSLDQARQDFENYFNYEFEWD